MKAAFREIKKEIRRRIVERVWGPGDLLPNEVDLAKEFGCARATVNRAMRELAEEGLVERKRKAGTRALVRRDVSDTPDWLRARLGLEAGGQVLHLSCMHYSDGNPYQFEDRWINLAALPQAAEADFTVIGPTEWLIAEVPFSDVEISFSAVSADADLAGHLGCATGDALFLAERSTWFEGRAITHVRLVFQRGYRMTTRY